MFVGFVWAGRPDGTNPGHLRIADFYAAIAIEIYGHIERVKPGVRRHTIQLNTIAAYIVILSTFVVLSTKDRNQPLGIDFLA